MVKSTERVRAFRARQRAKQEAENPTPYDPRLPPETCQALRAGGYYPVIAWTKAAPRAGDILIAAGTPTRQVFKPPKSPRKKLSSNDRLGILMCLACFLPIIPMFLAIFWG